MISKKFELKELLPEHCVLLYNWRNQSYIRKMMFDSELISLEDHQKWFASLSNNNNKIYRILYYQNRPYGIANFTIKNNQRDIGEWGFYIGEKKAPKGIGTLLGFLMLDFLFYDLKIRKVCAEVIDYNKISINFHLKLGFQQEGILKKYIIKNNRYYDVYLFSLFEEEWQAKRAFIQQEIERKLI